LGGNAVFRKDGFDVRSSVFSFREVYVYDFVNMIHWRVILQNDI
jgi:hypothetical protein